MSGMTAKKTIALIVYQSYCFFGSLPTLLRNTMAHLHLGLTFTLVSLNGPLKFSSCNTIGSNNGLNSFIVTSKACSNECVIRN